jgi:leader peptidase (prepilin peptidase)/N-methyltransferase
MYFNMADTVLKVILGGLLVLCGIQDIVNKKIYLGVVGVGAILVTVCIPFCNVINLPDRMGGLAVGVGVVLISLYTRGMIGMGDGLLLCVTGIALGFWGNVELFAIALFIAATLSVVLLIFRVVDRKKSLPFVPFLLCGYVIYLAAGVNKF